MPCGGIRSGSQEELTDLAEVLRTALTHGEGASASGPGLAHKSSCLLHRTHPDWELSQGGRGGLWREHCPLGPAEVRGTVVASRENHGWQSPTRESEPELHCL